MKKLPFVYLGLPAMAVVGSLTFVGRDNLRAAPATGDAPVGSPRVEIPAGSFRMGSDSGAADERPVHAVAGSAFALDRYEVTNARYAACVHAGACAAPALLSSFTRPTYFGEEAFTDYPVVHV